MPMVGFPVGLYALTDDVVLQILDLSTLMSYGIAWAEAAAFLETESGAEFRKSGGGLIKLDKGCAAYLPAGYMAMPVVVKEDDVKGDATDIGIFLAKAAFSFEMMFALDPDLQQCIETYHTNMNGKLAGAQKIWKERQETTAMFYAAAKTKIT